MTDLLQAQRIPPRDEVPAPPATGRVKKARFERYFEELLGIADIRVNGGRPWDIRVHDGSLFERLLVNGSLAMGEGYMEGGWDCDDLDGFFTRILSVRLDEKAGRSLPELWMGLKARAANLQKGRRAYAVGKRHYDLGNDFYQGMLDGRMTYSCGYWREAGTLDEAQEAKLDLICRKIGLEPGQRVLDIGCGWGSFAGYASERYGAEVTGVTVSVEQAKYAAERYAEPPVRVLVMDYREVRETFDHIVSVGMFEHVGHKNFRAYMETAHRCLADGGNFLLHTIGRNTSARTVDPWMEKYIFPNSMIPSASQITAAAEGLFAVRDWHSFGRDYDRTLMAWHGNFERNWEKIGAGLDERFRRMWRYYLLASAGAFRADDNQLWQILLSKPRRGGEHVNARWDLQRGGALQADGSDLVF